MRTIFYSPRHCLALSNVYSEMFGAPIPKEVSVAAAKSGRMQELMQAVDQATDDEQPITDWTPFAPASRASSKPTHAAL